MRILIISPYYFPNINPRPYRWTQIAQHWAKQGLEVHVVTEKNPNFEATTMLEGVHIHRTGYAALKSIVLKQQRGEAAPNQQPNKQSLAAKIFRWTNEKLWKRIYFPDDSCIWYFSALQKSTQILESQSFDIIISAALPFTAHLIGWRLKTRFPNLTWIADTGDPFSYQTEAPLNNHFLYQKLNIFTEKKILDAANVISVTTKSTKLRYINFHAPCATKIKVIPPLMTTFKTDNVSEKIKKFGDNQKLNFGYLGKFYTILREPQLLTNFIAQLLQAFPDWKDKIVFHIFGDVFPQFLEELRRFPQIKIHGLIPREQTQQAMNEMDILLNISNLTNYQLPSKAPDYLQSGKSILNIYNEDADEFKAFFVDFPYIYNHKDSSNISAALIDFLAKAKNQSIDKDEIIRLTAPYHVDSVAQAYLDAITNPCDVERY